VAAAAFWDSSALVPLCVRQSITTRASELYKIHNVVVWWATPVEISSALARLLRMKQLTPSQFTTARKTAERIADSWSVIQPSDHLRWRSIQLVERHGLRAADSFQLASALEWCEDDPRGRVFLTADQKLGEAALFTGFDAEKL
jgi:uncharacterized protein